MELVLSPGSLGDNDGAPFRNEDVQEWSHVDRLTGMLERARIETGRWRTNDQGTAQSYGKMIDSRQRNSADGSLVQKARRQVEVFQSQGTSGNSVQVVRASQWSSSKSTDSTFHIPPTSDHRISNIDNIVNRKLDCWKFNEQNSMLNELSYLCQKIHSEVANINGASSFVQDSFDKRKQLVEKEKRSTSNEDVASLIEVSSKDSENSYTSPVFTRDCKVRRSLQISNKCVSADDKMNDVKNDTFVNHAQRKDSDLLTKPHDKQYSTLRDIIGPVNSKSHVSSSNSFRKNDTDQSGLSNDIATNRISTVLLKGTPRAIRDDVPTEENRNLLFETNRFLLSKKSNKTVVHLSNDLITNQPSESETARRINVTAIELKKNSGSNSQQESITQKPGDNNEESANCTAGRPVKKVGFSKTEIHFAPDSGKVNIVETDGKPPPTNKFRRRRRNSLGLGSNPRNNVNSNSSSNNNNSNLPLVHFGDTSYEKYIFGGGKNPETVRDTNATVGEGEESLTEDCRDKWEKQLKAASNSNDDNRLEEHGKFLHANMHEKFAEQKHRGHTTTINFVTNAAVCEPRKVVQGTNEGIQLHFDKTLKEKSSRSILDIDKNPLVTHTTKMTVHIPLIMPQISRPLKQNSFSTLKSVKLVLNLKHSDNFDTKIIKNYVSDNNKMIKDFFSSFCEPNSLTLSQNFTNSDDDNNNNNKTLNNTIEYEENMNDDNVSKNTTFITKETSQNRSRLLKSRDSRNSGVDNPLNQCSSGIEIATGEIRACVLGSRIDQEQTQHRKFNDERVKGLLSSNEIHEKFSTSDLLALKSECVALEKTQNKKCAEDAEENVVSTDSENNQVFMKIVTTHKPVIARVENDHVPKAFKKRVEKLKLDEKDNNLRGGQKEYANIHLQDASKIEAKDICDKNVRSEETSKNDSVDDPTYVNVFEATSKAEEPIYANISVAKTKEIKIQPRRKETLLKKEQVKSKTVDKEDAKNGSKLKSKKFTVPVSATSSSVVKNVPKKVVKSHDTIKTREKLRSIDSHRSISKDRSLDVKQVKKDVVKSEKKTDSSNDTKSNVKSRSKKPIEVVYQTAIFNMRNEKLSKPTKTKEIKGPRYINDLICGSKTKRSSKNSTTQNSSNKGLPLISR